MKDQKQKPQEATYLTVNEAADRMKVKPCTIYCLCRTPDFPAVKLRKAWSIRQDLLDKWWEDQWEAKSQYFK